MQTIIEPSIDDREEYLKIIAIIIHATPKIKPNVNDIPKITPK